MHSRLYRPVHVCRAVMKQGLSECPIRAPDASAPPSSDPTMKVDPDLGIVY